MAIVSKAYTTTGSTQTFTGAVQFNGFSASSAGALGVIRVWDNTSAAGELLAVQSLAANTDVIVVFARPVQALVGVRVEVVTGTVTGSVYLN